MEECLNIKSIVLRKAFTDLLEGDMGRLQELLDKVAQKSSQKALKLLLKLSE